MMVSTSDWVISHSLSRFFSQLRVFPVNPFLNLLDHAIGEVTESSLKFDVLFHRPQFREVEAQMVPALLNFIERENTRLHGHPAQSDRKFRRRPPTGGADRKNVDIGRP